MNRNLSDTDRAALHCIGAGAGGVATHHIARACGFDHTRSHRSTTIARIMLRRLARWGYVEGQRGMGGGGIRWWSITAAGRHAIGSEA